LNGQLDSAKSAKQNEIDTIARLDATYTKNVQDYQDAIALLTKATGKLYEAK